jgi:hypothetical protein
LRLRRAIQGLLPESPVKAGPATPAFPNTPESPEHRPQDLTFTTASPTPQSKPRRASPTRSISHTSVHSGNGSYAATGRKKTNNPPPMRAGSISSLKTGAAPTAATLTPQMTPNKPLYAWEMASEMDEDTSVGGGGTFLYPSVLRDRIYTVEYGSFVPSSKRGIYIKEKNENDEGYYGSYDPASDSYSDHHGLGTSRYPSHNSSSSPTRQPSASATSPSPLPSTNLHHLDLQIIFSSQEFEAFLLRKSLLLKKSNQTPKSQMAAKHAAKYKDNSKCQESKFLRNQTPYVEPKRILKELYRPSQKDKWIDGKGFQLTNRKGIDED